MQAVGLESVELERRLLSECNQSVWYALSIADNREQLLARKAKFNALPSVERTEEIVSLLPVDDEIKKPIIQRINGRLADLPERPPLITITKPEKLGEALGQLQALVMRTGRAEKCARQLEQIRHLLRSMLPEDCYKSISLFQQQMAGDLLSRLHVLKTSRQSRTAATKRSAQKPGRSFRRQRRPALCSRSMARETSGTPRR